MHSQLCYERLFRLLSAIRARGFDRFGSSEGGGTGIKDVLLEGERSSSCEKFGSPVLLDLGLRECGQFTLDVDAAVPVDARRIGNLVSRSSDAVLRAGEIRPFCGDELVLSEGLTLGKLLPVRFRSKAPIAITLAFALANSDLPREGRRSECSDLRCSASGKSLETPCCGSPGFAPSSASLVSIAWLSFSRSGILTSTRCCGVAGRAGATVEV